jgi:hypothetical protein
MSMVQQTKSIETSNGGPYRERLWRQKGARRERPIANRPQLAKLPHKAANSSAGQAQKLRASVAEVG